MERGEHREFKLNNIGRSRSEWDKMSLGVLGELDLERLYEKLGDILWW